MGQVKFTKRSFTELVNRADPRRLTDPEVIYVFDNGKTKSQVPDQPGKDYRWAKELPDV